MNFRSVLYILIISLLSTVSTSVHSAAKVLLLSPYNPGSSLGLMRQQASFAAAKNLGIELTIKHADKYQTDSPADIKKLFSQQYDYLLTDFLPHTHHLLKAAERHNIKTIMIANPEPLKDLSSVGEVRGQFKNWIGSIHSNDYDVGLKLTKALYLGSLQPDTKIMPERTLLAFNGRRTSQSSSARKQGLIDSAKTLPITIAEIYEIDWNPSAATRPLFTALKRHPQATLMWAASDDISLEIIKKMKSVGKVANRDYFTAGVDWTPKALTSIANHEMLASFGGQFLNNCWALVLIYDHYHNYDFIEFGVSYSTDLQVIDKSNIATLGPMITNRDWNTIDFKRYSRRHNPIFDGYHFDVMRFLNSDNTP